jgi:adenosylmethionine-8-amino-7-oxononanoate aminotransferase
MPPFVCTDAEVTQITEAMVAVARAVGSESQSPAT